MNDLWVKKISKINLSQHNNGFFTHKKILKIQVWKNKLNFVTKIKIKKNSIDIGKHVDNFCEIFSSLIIWFGKMGEEGMLYGKIQRFVAHVDYQKHKRRLNNEKKIP